MLLVVGAGIGIVVAVSGAVEKPSSPTSSGAPLSGSNNTGHPPASDVSVAGCEINDAKFPVAHLKIRNTSKAFRPIPVHVPERAAATGPVDLWALIRQQS